MTELKFETSKCKWDDGIWLCLKISKGYEHAAQSFVFRMKDKPYTAQIKEYRKKRSLDANAYCWKLIGDIADALRTSKEEVYRLMLKRYGQGGMSAWKRTRSNSLSGCSHTMRKQGRQC